MLMRSICVAVGLMFLAIPVSGMADAQSSADVKCTSKIMRAGSKKVSCLVKARAKRGSDDSAVLERRTSRCRERYIDRFEAALERHGLESCTRVSSDDFADHLERIALQIAAASAPGGALPEIAGTSHVFGFTSTDPKKTGPSQYLTLVRDLTNYYGQTYSDTGANPSVDNDACFGDRSCSVSGKTNWGMVSATAGVTGSLDSMSWPDVIDWINELHAAGGEDISVAIYIGLPSASLTPAKWGNGDPEPSALDSGIAMALWIEYPTNHPSESEYNGYLQDLAAFVKKNPAITDIVLRAQDPQLFTAFEPLNFQAQLVAFPSTIRLHGLPYISTNDGGWCQGSSDTGTFCSSHNGCSDLGKECTGTNFADRLKSYNEQALPPGCSSSLEVSAQWVTQVPRLSGLTYDLEAGGCWALAKTGSQPAPADKQAFVESLIKYVASFADAAKASNSSAGSFPFKIDACTCYESGDTSVGDCFTGLYSQCHTIYLPVYNYAKQECNPDSDFWTTISHKKGGKQVFGMINAPNGSAATSVDWQAVEDCVSTYSSELSGICVDIEKSSQCSLSQTDVNALNHIAEVRVAVSEGTCGQAWPARA